MIKTERLVLRPFRKELGIFASWHMNKGLLADCGSGWYCGGWVDPVFGGYEL